MRMRPLLVPLALLLAGCSSGTDPGDTDTQPVAGRGEAATAPAPGGREGATPAAPAGPGETPATDAGHPHFAFVTNGVASFWVIAERGAEDGAAAVGAEVSVLMPTGGAVNQKEMLEDLVARRVDGIAVSPIDPDNQTSVLNMVAARTRLITHDSDAPMSNRLCYVGMDNYVAGRMCGELVKEAMPDGGTIFIFVGRLEQDNAKRRRQGLIDELLDRAPDSTRYDRPGAGELTNGKYTILGTLTDQFDRVKGKENAEDALSRYPDLDCMVGLFAYNPPLCLSALQQANKLDQVHVVAFDEADETLQGIIDGHVYGTVVQDPYNYGYRSMEVLAALTRGDDDAIPASGVVEIPARKIRADNVREFWADLKAKLGKGGE